MKAAKRAYFRTGRSDRKRFGLFLHIIISLLVGAAPASASAQSQIFVPADTSGDFGNPTDMSVPFVPAITVPGPSKIKVSYISGTVTDAGGEVNTGPNGAQWSFAGAQSPLEEGVGVSGGTIPNLDALIGVFVPQSRVNDPRGFQPLDGTKNVTPVGITPNSIFLVGEELTFEAGEAGTLFLGINDNHVGDNGGGYNVEVSAVLQPYNAAGQFSPTLNPNGAWSYGWSGSRSSAFNIDTQTFDLMGLNGWTSQCCGATQPDIYHNPTDQPINPAGTAPIPAGALALRPGSYGGKPILRWTASADGHYGVKAIFKGLDSAGPTNTHVAILLDAIQIFSGDIDGAGSSSSQTFSGTVSMLAGDTLDFTVGFGTNGKYIHDSTGLSVVITPIE